MSKQREKVNNDYNERHIATQLRMHTTKPKLFAEFKMTVSSQI